MKRSTSFRRVAALAVTAAALIVFGITGVAQSSSKNGLVGTWFVQVTLRDCVTNAPMGTINSLVTFHRGGTLSESTSLGAFAIGQRGPGTGTWDSEGHDQYLQRMVALMAFDTPANLPGTPGFNPALPVSPGFFAGWSTVTHRIEMTGRDSITSAGTNEFYRANGDLYRTGCSTATGVRFI